MPIKPNMVCRIFQMINREKLEFRFICCLLCMFLLYVNTAQAGRCWLGIALPGGLSYEFDAGRLIQSRPLESHKKNPKVITLLQGCFFSHLDLSTVYSKGDSQWSNYPKFYDHDTESFFSMPKFNDEIRALKNHNHCFRLMWVFSTSDNQDRTHQIALESMSIWLELIWNESVHGFLEFSGDTVNGEVKLPFYEHKTIRYIDILYAGEEKPQLNDIVLLREPVFSPYEKEACLVFIIDYLLSDSAPVPLQIYFAKSSDTCSSAPNAENGSPTEKKTQLKVTGSGALQAEVPNQLSEPECGTVADKADVVSGKEQVSGFMPSRRCSLEEQTSLGITHTPAHTSVREKKAAKNKPGLSESLPPEANLGLIPVNPSLAGNTQPVLLEYMTTKLNSGVLTEWQKEKILDLSQDFINEFMQGLRRHQSACFDGSSAPIALSSLMKHVLEPMCSAGVFENDEIMKLWWKVIMPLVDETYAYVFYMCSEIELNSELSQNVKKYYEEKIVCYQSLLQQLRSLKLIDRYDFRLLHIKQRWEKLNHCELAGFHKIACALYMYKSAELFFKALDDLVVKEDEEIFRQLLNIGIRRSILELADRINLHDREQDLHDLMELYKIFSDDIRKVLEYRYEKRDLIMPLTESYFALFSDLVSIKIKNLLFNNCTVIWEKHKTELQIPYEKNNPPRNSKYLSARGSFYKELAVYKLALTNCAIAQICMNELDRKLWIKLLSSSWVQYLFGFLKKQNRDVNLFPHADAIKFKPLLDCFAFNREFIHDHPYIFSLIKGMYDFLIWWQKDYRSLIGSKKKCSDSTVSQMVWWLIYHDTVVHPKHVMEDFRDVLRSDRCFLYDTAKNFLGIYESSRLCVINDYLIKQPSAWPVFIKIMSDFHVMMTRRAPEHSPELMYALRRLVKVCLFCCLRWFNSKEKNTREIRERKGIHQSYSEEEKALMSTIKELALWGKWLTRRGERGTLTAVLHKHEEREARSLDRISRDVLQQLACSDKKQKKLSGFCKTDTESALLPENLSKLHRLPSKSTASVQKPQSNTVSGNKAMSYAEVCRNVIKTNESLARDNDLSHITVQKIETQSRVPSRLAEVAMTPDQSSILSDTSGYLSDGYESLRQSGTSTPEGSTTEAASSGANDSPKNTNPDPDTVVSCHLDQVIKNAVVADKKVPEKKQPRSHTPTQTTFPTSSSGAIMSSMVQNAGIYYSDYPVYRPMAWNTRFPAAQRIPDFNFYQSVPQALSLMRTAELLIVWGRFSESNLMIRSYLAFVEEVLPFLPQNMALLSYLNQRLQKLRFFEHACTLNWNPNAVSDLLEKFDEKKGSLIDVLKITQWVFPEKEVYEVIIGRAVESLLVPLLEKHLPTKKDCMLIALSQIHRQQDIHLRQLDNDLDELRSKLYKTNGGAAQVWLVDSLYFEILRLRLHMLNKHYVREQLAH